MPATNTLPQLVVAHIGFDAPNGPKNSPSHPWRKTRRHGVVTVERAPGVARDASSRNPTPEEREALQRAVLDAWERGDASASDIGRRHNVSRSTVLGIVYRHRKATSTPSTPRAAHAPRPSVHVNRDREIATLLLTDSVADVAALYDLTPDTVRSVRRRARLDGMLPPAPVRPSRSLSAPAPTITAVACEAVERVPLMDARSDQCRDLADDGLCCGAPVVRSRSWCPEHLSRYTLRGRSA